MAIECAEIDILAPVSGGPQSAAVTDAIARGRHVQLSFLLATQRPHQCQRIISAQADAIYSFRMHEPRDLKFLKDSATPEYAAIVRQLGAYEVAKYDAATGATVVINRHGKVKRPAQVSMIEPPGE
jgi:hypothetical protein